MTVSAGELRAMGLAIPIEIPDCAWIERHNIEYAVGGVSADGDKLNVDMAVRFLAPFNWIELPVMLPPGVTAEDVQKALDDEADQ